jgi:RimJ/RimL family protein N-acetyltransferase
LAFERLDARRLEIRMDERNVRSIAVAERVGFELEGTFVDDSLDPQGVPRSTRVYARTVPPA